MLPLHPPVKPMLASPVDGVPRREGLLFEPKWDGFRCLAFVEPGSRALLQSRTGRGLERYFPEVQATLSQQLERPAVLDGELVVIHHDSDGDRLDWNQLSERIHPAASRVKALAERTPATFIAFDLLALDDQDLTGSAQSERRSLLADLGLDRPGLRTTPATEDPELAEEWFRLFEGAGLDGIIAKPLDGPYVPGKRTMLKIKHSRTVDCVVAGLRWHANTEPGTAVGSLQLGLHDEHGVLHHVGVVGAFSAARRRELAGELTELITEGEHPWVGENATGRRLPGSVNRWNSNEQPWVPLRPERVVEVSYDHTEGGHPARFRHTTQFVRWRPDRAPESCDYTQLDEPMRYDLDSVLFGAVHRTDRSSG